MLRLVSLLEQLDVLIVSYVVQGSGSTDCGEPVRILVMAVGFVRNVTSQGLYEVWFAVPSRRTAISLIRFSWFGGFNFDAVGIAVEHRGEEWN